MDRIDNLRYSITKSLPGLKRITNCSIVLLFAIVLLSNAANATVYRWIPSNGITVATGITTNWGDCGSKPTNIYVITLLTNASTSGCIQDSYLESGPRDPAADLFFNTAYTRDTNVQGNWYYGRIMDTSVTTPDVFTFRLIFVYLNGTIGVLPGNGSITIPIGGSVDDNYNISLTNISGAVPAGAKLGLRISKSGNSVMRIYFGERANIQGGPSGYFSITETPTLARIDVSPNPATVAAGGIQQFTATGYDSYGNIVLITPVWTAGTGSISPTGLYTAPTTSGSTTVTATSGSVSGIATVNVTILPTVRFINGSVMDSITKAGTAGVKVFTNTSISTTNASGFYSLAVTSGTYNIIAMFEPIYYTNTTTVSTIGEAVVWQDIELVKKPVGTITGSVTRCCTLG